MWILCQYIYIYYIRTCLNYKWIKLSMSSIDTSTRGRFSELFPITSSYFFSDFSSFFKFCQHTFGNQYLIFYRIPEEPTIWQIFFIFPKSFAMKDFITSLVIYFTATTQYMTILPLFLGFDIQSISSCFKYQFWYIDISVPTE